LELSVSAVEPLVALPVLKTKSRNVVLVESVSAPHSIITGAISGVQTWKSMDALCTSCLKIVAVCMFT
jgi:hypothetical protein